MPYTLTAVYQKSEEGGYVGFVVDLPGAVTQGHTLEEAREPRRRQPRLCWKAIVILVEERLFGQEVIREPLIFL